jgi:hypothetical protein
MFSLLFPRTPTLTLIYEGAGGGNNRENIIYVSYMRVGVWGNTRENIIYVFSIIPPTLIIIFGEVGFKTL